MTRILRSTRGLLFAAMMPLLATGCIDNTVDPELAEVDFLVGTWEATEMTMISEEDPQQTVDLMAAFDATFTFSVEPSGRYVATLKLGDGSPVDETGSLTVEGDSLVFTPDALAAYQSQFQVLDDGQLLILDGPSEFDFDGDLESEPAILHLELQFL